MQCSNRGPVAVAILAAALLAPAAALADEATAAPAPMRENVRAYYVGERTTALVFVSLGVASIAAGSVLVATQKEDFARGLGGAMLGFGVLEAAGAGFYALQVTGEGTHFGELVDRDPAAFKREEEPHIQKTVSRTTVYRLAELALALGGAGVATYGFVSGRDVWKGIGIGVAAESLTFFTIDSLVVQSRAARYEEQVRAFEPKVALQIGGGARPWGAAVGSRF